MDAEEVTGPSRIRARPNVDQRDRPDEPAPCGVAATERGVRHWTASEARSPVWRDRPILDVLAPGQHLRVPVALEDEMHNNRVHVVADPLG